MTGLYAHIPFCRRKCFYCSFVVAVNQRHLMGAYLNVLNIEAKHYANQKIGSIYFGGGTPTMLDPQQLLRLTEMIRQTFQIHPGCEITIEANPENINDALVRALKEGGVNRISLGIQTFNDKYLKYLGRCHDTRQALIAYDCIREAKFQNVNIDIMTGLQGQTEHEFTSDLKKAIMLKPEHISLYSLAIEPFSRFHVEKKSPKNSHYQASEYRRAIAILREAGLHQYEISNFSVPGKESRHNMNYWEGGNYIGLGMGAHSHFDGRRSWNISQLRKYIKAIHNKDSAVEGEEILDKEKRFLETLLIGLRLNKGVDVASLQKKLMVTLKEETKNEMQKMINQGFLIKKDKMLRATLKGRLVLDELCARLI